MYYETGDDCCSKTFGEDCKQVDSCDSNTTVSPTTTVRPTTTVEPTDSAAPSCSDKWHPLTETTGSSAAW